MKVKRFRGKIFYPVMYEGDSAALGEVTVTTNRQKTVPVFEKSSVHCEEMRKGLGCLLDGTHPNSIASVYTVARREVFFYPKNNKGLVFCTRNKRRVPIALGEIRFLLFETHVAFFQMDFELEDMSLEEAMNTTYYLCEVKDAANHFEYENQRYDPVTKQKTGEPVSFSLKEWFLRCASYLPGCRSFEDRPLEDLTAKPILYGYYLLDEKPENFERLGVNIAQNYKLSYKGAESGDHILQTFENSAWCVSYNGAINVSHQVEDPVTNQFFETTFAHKWASEYLFLFINTLHQKYAVLKYLAELNDLSCAQYDFALMRKLLVKGEVMQEKCAVLKNRSFFNLPSHVEHVNRVYGFFQWSFDIPGYLASLNAGVETSVSVCKSYVTRTKEVEDLEKSLRTTRNEMYIALITASITCLTFFNSFYGTLQHLLHGRLDQIDLSSLIVAATFFTTIATVAVNLTKQLDEMSDLRDQIRKLKSQTVTL